MKFGLDHAESLTKIAKDTLAAHTEDSRHNPEAGQEEEVVEKEEKKIVTEVVERKIVISEGVLLAELQKLHPKDKWCVTGLSCLADKMTVTVKGRWLKVDIEALIDLHIASLVANEKEQVDGVGGRVADDADGWSVGTAAAEVAVAVQAVRAAGRADGERMEGLRDSNGGREENPCRFVGVADHREAVPSADFVMGEDCAIASDRRQGGRA